MSGFIDLHSHYIPAIDDGVRSTEQGVDLCRGLAELGYARVVATPHIRDGMFDNRKPGLEAAFRAFSEATAAEPGMPELGLAAEHHFDSLFWDLQEQGEVLPYPGSKTLLIEFPNDMIPLGLGDRIFQLGLKGWSTVLAHPERYNPLFKRTEPIAGPLGQGMGAQLDLMSLRGRYGRAPRKAAERMLEEGVYSIACTDAHRPDDLKDVAKSIKLLFKRVGDDTAGLLLRDNPGRLLAGKPLA